MEKGKLKQSFESYATGAMAGISAGMTTVLGTILAVEQITGFAAAQSSPALIIGGLALAGATALIGAGVTATMSHQFYKSARDGFAYNYVDQNGQKQTSVPILPAGPKFG